MSAFRSEDAYWRFADSVLRHSRYVREPDVEQFLAALLAQAADKVYVVPEGTVLWRAQLGHDWLTREEDEFPCDEPVGFSADRMKPLQDRAVEGRANPKGIPYLYVATLRDTALAEARPWVGASISCAQFRTVRDLRVVACTEHAPHSFCIHGRTPEEQWDDDAWADVDHAFSRPVTPADDTADYVPTQVIAEVFKSGGFDGVAYASSVGDGYNVALFDLGAVEMHGCAVYALKSIAFEFQQSGNHYVVQRSREGSGG